MPFLQENVLWDYTAMTCGGQEIERVKDKNYDCNILCNDKDCLRKNKIEKKNNYEVSERLGNLAKPKRVFYPEDPVKDPGLSIDILEPRLRNLAIPKHFTPKYEKPHEEPFVFPGKIRDWEAHQKWLADRAKSKKDFSEPCEPCTPIPYSPKISRQGMERIRCLAMPRPASKRSVRSSGGNVKRKIPEASGRIIELSRPVHRCFDDALVYPLKVSKSAMCYQASERIKALAFPKRGKSRPKSSIENSGKCFGQFNSFSCGTYTFEDCTINPPNTTPCGESYAG